MRRSNRPLDVSETSTIIKGKIEGTLALNPRDDQKRFPHPPKRDIGPPRMQLEVKEISDLIR